MRIITRYVLREFALYFFMALAATTSLLVLRRIFLLTKEFVRKDVSLWYMAELVGYVLPGILVLAIPIALLVGMLMALGQLGFTGEITAMRASGIGAHQLILPVALVGAAFTVLDYFLIDYAVPWGNTEHLKLRTDIARQNPAMILEEGTIMRSLETAGIVWFYERTDPVSGRLLNVRVWDDFRDGHPRFSLASEGTVGLHEGRGALTLLNGVSYERESDQLTTVVRNRFAREIIYIPLEEDVERSTKYAFKHYRAMSQKTLNAEMTTIRERLAKETSDIMRGSMERSHRRAAVEWHKKFTIPFACLAFALVGVPMGVITRRSGFMVGLVYGLPLIIVYYAVLRVGETVGAAGSMAPWLGAWLPNFLVLVVAGSLTRQMLRR
ncbi:YjgP/YjgQ family permease [Candidatus Poribacteria bacterium]|nr:YjgP/YjgQ family permease [Candidatus Poribacteria bacterium]MBT5712417.1 YjgP/YjgQ family permease [Candidatus Poribacteria bacterium]MBT7099318.1 YjgP/YjgQ family permease [Candidatus Poribacteria bacterium]MBT7808952.1 YjgP/YjgQ family permease [Candidatus Poribacteria bacterium]